MTTAELWTQIPGGRWLQARKPFVCRDLWFLSDGTKVWHTANVLPGERYFDTNEHQDGSSWDTITICAWCATRLIDADGSHILP
jgi:hypothetical protein